MKFIKTSIAHPGIFLLSTVALMSALSCTSDTDTELENKKQGVQFYTAAKPGPWANQSADHDVEITITRDSEGKTIHVYIPFAAKKEQRHYVESILILDSKGKELQKKSFLKGRGSDKGATFNFPENFNEPVFVVLKCNLHDMWEKKVAWSE